MTKGYSAASMDDIVQACGMSKKTVYLSFDTKLQLFNELLGSAVDEVFPVATDVGMDDVQGRCSEDLLRCFLGRMAGFIMSPRRIELARLVLTESRTAPELGAAFFENGVKRGHDALVQMIRQIGTKQGSGFGNPDELADLLMGGILGHRFYAVLIGHSPAPSPSEIAEKIEVLLDFVRPSLCAATRSITDCRDHDRETRRADEPATASSPRASRPIRSASMDT